MQQLFVPDTSKNGVVTYQVMVNGKVANPVYELLSLVVTHESNKVPTTKLIFKDGDPATKTFSISEQNDFIPGVGIVVKLGRDGTNTQVFKGIVIRHSVRVKENGQSELAVDCRDEVVRMTVGRHSKYYLNALDSDVMNTLVSAYADLSCSVKATSLQHEELVQHHTTDWDFLLMRAEANGMLVNTLFGALTIEVPQTTKTPALTVTYGSSILEFEAEMDARTQWNNVEARSWDYHNQALFTADSSSVPGWTEAGNILGSDLAQTIKLDNYEMHHSGYLTELELQTWVDGVMVRSALAKICGRAKCKGFSGINPGDMLTVAGVGNRFNGNVYVTAVRHEVGNGMWDTHIQFGLNARRYAELYQDIDDKPAAALLGGIRGLQIGVTVQLEGDPAGQDRILVRLPVIDNENQGDGIWTRIASLDAGQNRGAFYRPEVGDEVIVGFINDDPRDAVVLGMLNSSAKPAPWPTTKANDIKGFTSRSSMRIFFDDGQKQITLVTPAGNQIMLDDTGQQIVLQDQNQNSITMDATGITLSSTTGAINIQAAAGNIQITSGASLSAEGLTTSVTGDTSLTLTATTVAIN
jgi:Rhs element Vgr protein